jgi:hypothetical protein
MKARTIALAGIFARTAGLAFGAALIVMGITEALHGFCACMQSEKED